MNSYRVPSGPGEAEYDEKRSRFLGYVRPVNTEEEARRFIEEIKKRNYDARHNCWCYIINNGPERYSDDGEPQGTAGIPMLEVFRKEGVSDAVCVVTRYFGGVLLGAGGLLRAYTKAAKDALTAAGISEMCPMSEYAINCSYASAERLKVMISSFGAAVTDTEYGADVRIRAAVKAAEGKAFSAFVFDAGSGTVTAEKLRDYYGTAPTVGEENNEE